MDWIRKIKHKYYHLRGRYYRDSRMIFPSPAEIRFIRLMGGKVVTVGFFKHLKTGFPLAVVLTMGKTLRQEQVRREVRVGGKYVDFGNDINRGIEVDGKAYHTDIIAQVERDEYFNKHGWLVLHIPAIEVFNQPDKVQRKVLNFLRG